MKFKKINTFIVIGILICVMGACNTNSPEVEKREELVHEIITISKDTINDKVIPANNSNDELLSVEKAKIDLESLERTITNVHPSTIGGFDSELEELINGTIASIQKPITKESFFFKVQRILSSLHDAHTSINVYTPVKNEKTTTVKYIWLSNGLYIKEDIGPLKKGDQIVAMGERDTQDIFDQLAKVISHENDNWVRAVGEQVLTREYFIGYLNLLDKEQIKFQVLRKGKRHEVSIPVKDFYGTTHTPRNNSHENFSFELVKEDSIGVFKLDSCINDQEYRKGLETFFQLVNENNIDNIVIDLRENHGGDSSVIDEFLEYLPIEQEKGFGTILRISGEANAQRRYDLKVDQDNNKNTREYQSSIQNLKESKKKGLLFEDKVFALVSKHTFSSGNWFGVIVQDNNIGTLIGEPTGNAPSSYGDILNFELLYSNFKYTMSHKYFQRPDENRDENSLQPDILVKTTIDDILNNADPQYEMVKQLIKEESDK